jgi:hypothetical protein
MVCLQRHESWCAVDFTDRQMASQLCDSDSQGAVDWPDEQGQITPMQKLTGIQTEGNWNPRP